MRILCVSECRITSGVCPISYLPIFIRLLFCIPLLYVVVALLGKGKYNTSHHIQTVGTNMYQMKRRIVPQVTP